MLYCIYSHFKKISTLTSPKSLIDCKLNCSASDVGISHITISIIVSNKHTILRMDLDTLGVPEEFVSHLAIDVAVVLISAPLAIIHVSVSPVVLFEELLD